MARKYAWKPHYKYCIFNEPYHADFKSNIHVCNEKSRVIENVAELEDTVRNQHKVQEMRHIAQMG